MSSLSLPYRTEERTSSTRQFEMQPESTLISCIANTTGAVQYQLPLELWDMVFQHLFSGMQLWVTEWDNNHPRIAFHRDFVEVSRVKTLLSMLGITGVHECLDSWNYENRLTSFSLSDLRIRDVLFAGSSSEIMRFLVKEACWCVFPWDPENEFKNTLHLEKAYRTNLKHMTMVLPSQLGPLGISNPAGNTETLVWEDGQILALDTISHVISSLTVKTLNVLVTVNSDYVGNLLHACYISDALYETWLLMNDAESPLLGRPYPEMSTFFTKIDKSLSVTARFVPTDQCLYRHEVCKSYSTITEEMSDIFEPLTWSEFQESEKEMGSPVSTSDDERMLDEREEFQIVVRRHWRFGMEESLRFGGRKLHGRHWVPHDFSVHGPKDDYCYT